MRYLNVTDMSLPNSKEVALGNGPVELPVNAIDAVDNTDAQTYNIIPVEPLTEVSPARFAESKIDELQDTLGLGDTKSSWYPTSVGDAVPRSLSDEVKETMDVRDIDLSWQPGIDETIDPFGLKVEFKEKGPILDQPSDSDKEPYDIAWDICPDLTRKERRIWKRYYDGRHRKEEFKVGDLVVLKFNQFGSGYKSANPHTHKFAPIDTPVRITEKLSPLSYRIEFSLGSKMHNVVSIIHLR